MSVNMYMYIYTTCTYMYMNTTCYIHNHVHVYVTTWGRGRLLECENPPHVLVNAHPPLFPACQLSAPWAFARAVTVYIYMYVSVFVFRFFLTIVCVLFLQVHAVHAPSHQPHCGVRLRRVRLDRLPRAHRLLFDAGRHGAVQRTAAECASHQVVQEGALATHRQRTRYRQDLSSLTQYSNSSTQFIHRHTLS